MFSRFDQTYEEQTGGHTTTAYTALAKRRAAKAAFSLTTIVLNKMTVPFTKITAWRAPVQVTSIQMLHKCSTNRSFTVYVIACNLEKSFRFDTTDQN